jgi:hypothetical protein
VTRRSPAPTAGPTPKRSAFLPSKVCSPPHHPAGTVGGEDWGCSYGCSRLAGRSSFGPKAKRRRCSRWGSTKRAFVAANRSDIRGKEENRGATAPGIGGSLNSGDAPLCRKSSRYVQVSCPRGDLNTETGEISPDRGNHAIRVTRPRQMHPGIPRRVRYLVRRLACTWLRGRCGRLPSAPLGSGAPGYSASELRGRALREQLGDACERGRLWEGIFAAASEQPRAGPGVLARGAQAFPLMPMRVNCLRTIQVKLKFDHSALQRRFLQGHIHVSIA